jgi:hypothetical protein
MQHTRIALSCGGAFLLVLASASYAADTSGDVGSPTPEPVNAPSDGTATFPPDSTVGPADNTTGAPAESTPASPTEGTVSPAGDQVSAATDLSVEAIPSSEARMASDPCADRSAPGAECERLKRRVDPSATKTASSPTAACTSHMDAKGSVIYDDPACPSRMGAAVVSSPHAVYLIRENPFFNLHIEKAVEHARAAEIAGQQGQAIDLLEHAQMSLIRAKEAQRAGNVSGLNEGIMSLREALRLPEASSIRDATAYVRDARKNLSQAGGLKYKEIQPQGVVATSR